MTTRKAIKSVLDNFLGTYISRYSDYDGYWLFGFLVKESPHLKINLLSTNVDTTISGPESIAVVLLNSFGRRSPLGDAGRIKRWLESGVTSNVANAARAHEQKVRAELGLL